MAQQCSRFLTWALSHSRQLPRIPRKREGSGGFSPRLKRAFWGHALQTIEKTLADSPNPEDF
jgi:hypothetical protein